MIRSRSIFLFGFASLAACSSSKNEPGSTLTTKDVPPDTTPLPALDLVGTSAPGDVWTFRDNKLTTDNGTPGIPTDDWSASGTLSGLGSIPGGAADDADGFYIFRPDGFPAEQGIRVVKLDGLGWVFYVPAGLAHPEPSTVVAVERANCMLPSSGDYRTFEVAAPTRPDGFRAPSRASFTNGDLAILPYRQENAAFRWDMHGVACAFNGAPSEFRPATMTTYWTTAPNSPFPYSTPTPAEVTGAFSPSGAFMLDYGRGFGGTIAVPSATALPTSDADITALAPLYRNRAFAGFFTATTVTQPAGANRQDPNVVRTAHTRSFWMRLGTTDNQLASLSFYDLDADRPVAANTSASFDLSALGGETGGAVILVNARDQGVNDLVLTGPILRSDPNTHTISMVTSGYSGSTESNGFLDAVRAPVPAGQELYSSLYVAYQTLVPPRSCNAATLARPPGTSPAVLVDGVGLGARITPMASGIGLTVNGRFEPLPVSPARATNGMEVKRDAPLTIDDPIPGKVWRLSCGPDYLWAPGARQDAQIGHGFSSSGALTPGTYILEHGSETATSNAADPTATYFVLHLL